MSNELLAKIQIELAAANRKLMTARVIHAAGDGCDKELGEVTDTIERASAYLMRGDSRPIILPENATEQFSEILLRTIQESSDDATAEVRVSLDKLSEKAEDVCSRITTGYEVVSSARELPDLLREVKVAMHARSRRLVSVQLGWTFWLAGTIAIGIYLVLSGRLSYWLADWPS